MTFVMCDLNFFSCCNLVQKLNYIDDNGDYCPRTGLWLPSPTWPTHWNPLVIITNISLMSINTVAVECCPYARPPSLLSFSIFLNW